VPDQEPQFQGAEPPPELDVPVAVVDYGPGLGRLIPQILGQNAQRLNERLAIRHPKATAVEVRSHPFMRIEIVAIGEFDSVLEMAEFRADHGGA